MSQRPNICVDQHLRCNDGDNTCIGGTCVGSAPTCNPRTAADWYNDGCYFSDPTSPTVAGLGTHNRVVPTTSCEVSCPVDGGDFVVYSQPGA